MVKRMRGNTLSREKRLRFESLESRTLLSVSGAAASGTGEVDHVALGIRYDQSDWFEPHLSGDGRYAAVATATALVAEDTNGEVDVYVVDLETDEATWASATYNGSQPDDGSWKPEISLDGRYVAFMSMADNLVPEDTDPSIDLFVFDRDTESLECITADVDGDAVAARFSGDAQRIVYEFEIGDTVPGDANAATKDIILYDRTTEERLVVTEGYDGQTGNSISWRPHVSEDGRFVAFQSESSNLVPNDATGTWDVFVYDTVDDTMQCVSVNADGDPAGGFSESIRISANGDYVTFNSTAMDMTAPGTDIFANIFLLDQTTGELTTIAGDGVPEGTISTIRPDISSDGRFVVYGASDSMFFPTSTLAQSDMYVYDRLTGQTACVSVAADGLPSTATTAFASISADGSRIAFLSDATTILSGVDPSSMDLFVMANPFLQETELGETAFFAAEGLDLTEGSVGYSFSTANAGLLTVEGSLATLPGDVTLQLYDGEGTLVEEVTGADEDARLDLAAAAGTAHSLWVSGTATDLDLRICNVVEQVGAAVVVHGTDEDDVLACEAGATHLVAVNSVGYEFDASQVRSVHFACGGGTDEVSLVASTASSRFYSYADRATLADSRAGYRFSVEGVESLAVDAPDAGREYAFLYDSTGQDSLDATPQRVIFTRAVGTEEETTTTVAGFERVYAFATQGDGDEASLAGSETSRDRFYGYADRSILADVQRSFYFCAQGFDTAAAASIGSATSYAALYDGPGNDCLETTPTSASMEREGTWTDTVATGFQRVYAYATRGGVDAAALTGNEAGGNCCRAYPTYVTLTDETASFYRMARGFDSTAAYGSPTDAASDRAYLYDSRGDDTLTEAFPDGSEHHGAVLTDGLGTYENAIAYFDFVLARSTDRGTTDTIDVDEESLAFRLLCFGTW